VKHAREAAAASEGKRLGYPAASNALVTDSPSMLARRNSSRKFLGPKRLAPATAGPGGHEMSGPIVRRRLRRYAEGEKLGGLGNLVSGWNEADVDLPAEAVLMR
jgi:hypothetical protein